MSIRTVAHPPALLVLAGLLLAGQPPAAQAATFCALSGDQLRTMLGTAAGNGQADQIRITTGVKKTSTSFPLRWPFVTSEGHGLDVSGGWNAGCTQQVAGPRATVLDGDGTDEVMRLQFQADSAAEVSVSNLTIANGRSTNNSSRLAPRNTSSCTASDIGTKGSSSATDQAPRPKKKTINPGSSSSSARKTMPTKNHTNTGENPINDIHSLRER